MVQLEPQNLSFIGKSKCICALNVDDPSIKEIFIPIPYAVKCWRDKFWQTYAYQAFGNNKVVNHLCSTFKICQRLILVRLNFGKMTCHC